MIYYQAIILHEDLTFWWNRYTSSDYIYFKTRITGIIEHNVIVLIWNKRIWIVILMQISSQHHAT